MFLCRKQPCLLTLDSFGGRTLQQVNGSTWAASAGTASSDRRSGMFGLELESAVNPEVYALEGRVQGFCSALNSFRCPLGLRHPPVTTVFPDFNPYRIRGYTDAGRGRDNCLGPRLKSVSGQKSQRTFWNKSWSRLKIRPERSSPRITRQTVKPYCFFYCKCSKRSRNLAAT